MFKADDSEWFGEDKWAHFVGSAALAAAGTDFMDSNNFPNDNPRTNCQNAVWSVGLTLAIGAAKEGYDVSRNQPFSSKDMVANLAGALTGAMIAGRCP